MAYTQLNWEDSPSVATPLSAENLNKMDDGIKTANDGVDSITNTITGTNGINAQLAKHTSDIATKLTDEDNSVKENNITNYAVTTLKIADGAVTTKKLPNSAITTLKIADGNITLAKLAQAVVDLIDSKANTDDVYLADEADENFIPKTSESGGGVVTDYIADKAVTVAKLGDDVKKTINDKADETELDYYDFVDITSSLTTEACYYQPNGSNAGTKIDYVNGISAYFATTAGKKYKVSGKSLYNVALAVFFKADGSFLSTYGLASGTQFTDEIVTIPDNCGFVAFQSHTSGAFCVKEYKVSSTLKSTLATEIDHTIDYNNPLRGNSIYCDGDSIAYGQGSNGYSYADFIVEINKMTMTKAAVSGTSLAVRDGRTDSIFERINALTGSYDYILLSGGINDMFLSLPLGTLSDSYNGSYDTSTAVGALESICYKLITDYFTSKKLFVLTHKKISYSAQSTYWDAYKSVLKKWGIPYVDISEQTNLCAYNDTLAQTWFMNGDGTHPTKAAYEKFYVPQITAALKRI